MPQRTFLRTSLKNVRFGMQQRQAYQDAAGCLISRNLFALLF